MRRAHIIAIAAAIAALSIAYFVYANHVGSSPVANTKLLHLKLVVIGDWLIAFYDNGSVFSVGRIVHVYDSGIRRVGNLPNVTTPGGVIKARLRAVIENGTIKAIIVIFDNGTEITITNIRIYDSGIRKINTTNTEKPQVITISQGIQGTLAPGPSNIYGPYPSASALEFALSWVPTSTGLCVGYFYAETNTGEAYCGWGGNLSYQFSLTDVYTAYAAVFNPFAATVTYQGTLTAYLW